MQKENDQDEVTIYWFSLLELTELGSGVNVSGINAKKTKKTESESEPTRCGVRAAEGMKTSKVGKTLKLISTSKQTPKHEDPPATQRNKRRADRCTNRCRHRLSKWPKSNARF